MAALGICSVEKILDRAIKELQKEEKVRDFQELTRKLGLSAVMDMIEKKAHGIYKVEEEKAVKRILVDQDIPSEIIEKVIKTFLGEGLVTRIPNIRRARAGRTSEMILMKVLNAVGIPCEKCTMKVKGYSPDMVVPSNAVLKSSPEKAVVIAIKRTLRERWAEDIDLFRKFKHGKFVLLTPDPDLSEDKANDMIKRGMKEIYVPDSLYEKNKDFIVNYSELKKHSQLDDDLTKFLEVKQ